MRRVSAKKMWDESKSIEGLQGAFCESSHERMIIYEFGLACPKEDRLILAWKGCMASVGVWIGLGIA